MGRINYITGDLFETHCDVIMHGCNAQGAFGSGVAGAIRKKWPGCYNAYREAYENPKLEKPNHLPLGHIVVWYGPEKTIFNAITQPNYGYEGSRYVSYDAIYEATLQANKLLQVLDKKEVALPLIGAGLGGGSWPIISKIIETNIISAKVYVYTLDGVIPLGNK